MTTQQRTPAPATRRKRLVAAALWCAGLAAVGAIIITSWHLTLMATSPQD
jgi:hypothetical protein